MTFKENKDFIIEKLRSSSIYRNDTSLKLIIEILKKIETINDLTKNKDLINRIAIDSIED